MLAINFFNLTILYFRHHSSPIMLYARIIAGFPFQTFVAIYWKGAIMVPFSLTSFIVGNVFIQGILAYGLFLTIYFYLRTHTTCRVGGDMSRTLRTHIHACRAGERWQLCLCTLTNMSKQG